MEKFACAVAADAAAAACRLDKLRTLVPHAERANTASFLEEVIHYIEELQALLKCGPNHSTGAPPTHPSAALAAAVQQQQRQPQVGTGVGARVMVYASGLVHCTICRQHSGSPLPGRVQAPCRLSVSVSSSWL